MKPFANSSLKQRAVKDFVEEDNFFVQIIFHYTAT